MKENDWITIVFIVVFILLSTTKWLYKERLYKLTILFFSKDYLLSYTKENQLIINKFNAFLFIIQIIVFTLLTFAYITFYKPTILTDGSSKVFFKIILGHASFFFFRYIIGKLLGVLFDIKQQQEGLTFLKMSYLYSTSLLILPLLLFTFYIKNHNLLVFHLSMIIFTILLIARYLLILKNNKKSIFSHLSYFILYLCALEIAPVLLIFKIIV